MHLGAMAGYRLAIAGQYDGVYASLGEEASRARHAALAPYLARVLAALDLPDEGAHLDLGCGDGLCALAVLRARPDLRVVGLDASPRALQLARALAGADARLTLLEGDAEAPPGGPFRTLSALSLLDLMPDKPAALAAWRRVAAPGARLVVTDGVALRGPGTLGAGAPSHALLAQAARAAGWRIERREDLTPLVRRLHEARVWPWPEYVRAGFGYGLVAMRADGSYDRHMTP